MVVSLAEIRQTSGEVFMEGCPTRVVLDHIMSKWGVLVLLALTDGTLRWGELRREVVLRIHGAGGRCHGPEASEGEHCDWVLDCVRTEDGADVTLCDSQARQRGRSTIDQPGQIGVRDGAPAGAVHEGRTPAAPGRARTTRLSRTPESDCS